MSEQISASNGTPTNDLSHATSNRVAEAMTALKSAGDGGASWFFWIAALSLVNTAITHSGGDRHFIVGLAITAIVDVIAAEIGKENPAMATGAMVVAIGFSIFVATIVVLFGWISRKRYLWVFGIGMFLYLLDGLLYLALGDFLSAGFHGYALYSMIQGFNAYRKLNQLESAVQNATEEIAETPETNPEAGFETA